MSKYLFISPHLDDSELAAGGTIARMKEEGHKITVVTLSTIYEGVNLSLEWISSMNTLMVDHCIQQDFKTRFFDTQHDAILQYLFTIQKDGYDFVFAPSSVDFHSDHSTVGRICERVFKHVNLVSYTHPWNTRGVTQNYFIQLKEKHISKKTDVLSCYKSQLKRNYFDEDYTYAEAKRTGVICGSEYAEGFQVVNFIA